MVILAEVSFSKTINNPGNKRSRTSSNTWVSRRSGLDGFKGAAQLSDPSSIHDSVEGKGSRISPR